MIAAALLAAVLVAQTGRGARSRPVRAPAPGDGVQIVLYPDFQCPFCAQFAVPVRQLQTDGVHGVKTTVTFKNFPLSIHPGAQLAHQAAMAAKAQGKFWEMHDLLFANQGRVQRSDLVGYAQRHRPRCGGVRTRPRERRGEETDRGGRGRWHQGGRVRNADLHHQREELLRHQDVRATRSADWR